MQLSREPGRSRELRRRTPLRRSTAADRTRSGTTGSDAGGPLRGPGGPPVDFLHAPGCALSGGDEGNEGAGPTSAQVRPGPWRPAPKPDSPAKRATRRNDSSWRAAVLASYGYACAACGDTAHVQADHLWPRAQGGPSDVENGLPLCGPFSRVTSGGCHDAKTAGRLRIDPGWLTAGQRAYLAAAGWVAWDEHGAPYGRGHRHFAPAATTTTRQAGS